jgi:hypothetical protein
MALAVACVCFLFAGVAHAGTAYYLYDSNGNLVAVLDASNSNLTWCQNATTATTATALGAQPANCGANTGAFAYGIKSNGDALCAYPRGDTIVGPVPATAVPLSQAATALAANGTNCSAGYAATGVDAAGNAEGCFAVSPPTGIPGVVFMFAGATCPTGSLPANGSAVSRTTYAGLFTKIGTVHGGGDGSTTFNLPDLRGEFVRGLDSGRGVDSGRTLGSAQSDAFQGHWHNVEYPNGGGGGVRITQPVASSVTTAPWVWTDSKATGVITNGANGVPRIASETRPRNKALLYCVQY